MSRQGSEAAQIWKDQAFATAWADSDQFSDMLEFPRKLAASMVSLDGEVSTIVDIASGPGATLEVFLDLFPQAQGVWMDASEAMFDLAQERLQRFRGRVTFQLGDMTELSSLDLPLGVDVVVTSRASHHLDKFGLGDFYRSASGLLKAGGWLINLDHIGPSAQWDLRYRALRKVLTPSRDSEPKHHHNYPLASIEDHLEGFRNCGVTDVDIAWKAFYTCLFMGRT